jgi:hypothetical protein
LTHPRASRADGCWRAFTVLEPVAAEALSRHVGLPVRNGTSRFELSPGRRKAIGTLNGRDFVTGEIIVGNDEFAPTEGLVNYMTRAPSGDGVFLAEVPFALEARAAQPVSVIFDAPAGDAFAGHRIARLDWALEVRNDAFSICFPRPVLV